MDSRGKQRLTGAVILVALFVLLVPELLTGPEKSGSAPVDDGGLKTHFIDVESPGSETSEPAAPAPPVNLARSPTPTPTPVPAQRAVPGEAAAPAAEDDESAAIAPAPMPAQEPAPAVTQPAPAKPARAASGRFAVQLGSFGVRENADRLVREMNSRGFATFITPTSTNGRQLYQVRVGPTRDRASAEALAAQLKRVGQSGSVVPIP